MSKDTFGPAFPLSVSLVKEMGCIITQEEAGITKRDYFAAHALVALIMKDHSHHQHLLSHRAYEISDAMLKQRDQDQ